MTETQRLKRNEYMRQYRKQWCREMSPEKKAHWNAMRRANQAAHPETTRAKSKRFRDKIRDFTLAAYGGACVCCGEDEAVFLTLDHIIPIRSKCRQSSHQLYMKLRKEQYPSGYQLLCYNCNAAKRTDAECPHAKLVKEKVHMKNLLVMHASPPLTPRDGVTA